MKKLFLWIIIIGIILGIIVGIQKLIHSQNDNEIEDKLTSGDSDIHELNIPIMEIDSLNPLLTNNIQVSYLLNLIYEPLVTTSRDEVLTPVLATEWAPKDDLHWIIKLRKDVKWHNDADFTARDVVFTILSLQDEGINSIYKSNVANIAQIEVLDEYSVAVTLLQKDDFLLYKLNFPIIPEFYFKDGDILNQDKNNIPIGTGPYRYVTTNYMEEFIQLERNKNWWNQEDVGKLDTIYLMMYPTYGESIKSYKSAKVDCIITSMIDWKKKFGTIGNNIYSFESSTFDTIIPNTKKPLLSDSSIRKAILLSINRENISQKVLESNATITDIPVHNLSKNYFFGLQSEYDIDKAKQVLMNAGWKNVNQSWQKEGQKLKFSLLVNEENAEQVKYADIIKENLEEMDIAITIQKVNFQRFQSALASDNFDLAIASLDIKNELTVLEMVETNHAFNYANYSNEKMDEAVQQVRDHYDEKSMQALSRIYKEETPYIGLLFRNNTLLTNKSVKGIIEPYWNNPYYNLITWCK